MNTSALLKPMHDLAERDQIHVALLKEARDVLDREWNQNRPVDRISRTLFLAKLNKAITQTITAPVSVAVPELALVEDDNGFLEAR